MPTRTRQIRWVLAWSLVVVLAPGLALAAATDEPWLGPYPPLAVVEAQMRGLVEARPDLVELVEIGRSVEGRPLYALHFGRRDGQARPAALLAANIHAGEVISSQVVMGVAEKLAEADARDPEITALLDQSDFWIIPIVNPDGYHRVISTAGQGGKIGTRKNADGVDLNRNFPLAPGAKSRHPLAGSHRPRSSYYMGPQPLSEPETRAYAELADRVHFYVAINGHSVAGKFLYPHCYTKQPAAHRPEFIRVGQAFAQAQPTWKYKVQNSYGWYPTLGDADDFLYMRHGVLSFTVEHGTISHNLAYFLGHPREFWIMNPADAQAWVDNDRDAILAAVREALAITGGEPYDPGQCHPAEQ